MIGNKDGITIKKETASYIFNPCIESWDGEFIGIWIELRNMKYKNLHIWSTHAILGHPSNHLTNVTAEKMGLEKVNMEATCESFISTKQNKRTCQNT